MPSIDTYSTEPLLWECRCLKNDGSFREMISFTTASPIQDCKGLKTGDQQARVKVGFTTCQSTET